MRMTEWISVSTTAAAGTSTWMSPVMQPPAEVRFMERMLSLRSRLMTSVMRFTMPVVSSAVMRMDARNAPSVRSRQRASMTR